MFVICKVILFLILFGLMYMLVCEFDFMYLHDGEAEKCPKWNINRYVDDE